MPAQCRPLVRPCVWVVLVACFGAIGWGSEAFAALSNQERADRLVAAGKAALVARKSLGAFQRFRAATRFVPEHPEANFYLALTRLLTLSMRRGVNLLRNSGVTGPNGEVLKSKDTDPLQFVGTLPEDFLIPLRPRNTSNLQDRIAIRLIPELLQSLSELDRVPQGFQSSLAVANPLTGTQAVEVDDGDVSLSRSLIQLVLAKAYVTQLYNVDVRLQDITPHTEHPTLDTAREFLETYPDFLRIRDASQASLSKGAFIAAIDHYLEAEGRILGETDTQDDDLFAFSTLPEDIQKQAVFHRHLVTLRSSLTGLSDPAWTLTLDQVIHLGDFFDRPLDIRSLETGGGFQSALVTYLLHQSQRGLTNLNNAPVTFTEVLDPEGVGAPPAHRPLEIDYGELLALQAGLESVSALASLLATYDLEGNMLDLAGDVVDQRFDVQQALGQHPNALRVKDLASLSQAKITALRAVERALDASAYVRESDDSNQSDDLFRLEGELARLEAHWRLQAEQFRSLAAVVQIDPDHPEKQFRVNFNSYFDSPEDPRDFLPKFEGTKPIRGTLPGPTLGGLLPDFTQESWQ